MKIGFDAKTMYLCSLYLWNFVAVVVGVAGHIQQLEIGVWVLPLTFHADDVDVQTQNWRYPMQVKLTLFVDRYNQTLVIFCQSKNAFLAQP